MYCICTTNAYTLYRWHYTCIDLQAIIANGFTLPEDYDYNGVLYLEGFGFYADEDPLSQGFYLDEVSFSHSARNLNTTVCHTHEKLHLHLIFFHSRPMSLLFVPMDSLLRM